MSSSPKPIHQLLDLLGRRWALRILWKLHADEAMTFRALQGRCGDMSASVLNDRLAELREAGIADRRPDGYVLSRRGSALLDALAPMEAWAKRWARRPTRP